MDMDLPDAVFDAQLLAGRVAALLGPQARAQDVIALYRAGQARAGRATHDRAVAAALVSDFHFRAPGEGFARGHAAHGHPAWQYVLEWSSPDARLDAYHGICTPLVFGTYEAAPSVGKGEVLRRVSQTVQDAWIAFARSGDPSTPALGSWPRFAAAERFTLRLGERPQLARGYRSEELALWPRAH
jgi:para-nitrobenzyl esterase